MRATRIALSLAAAIAFLVLFLVPVVPISVSAPVCNSSTVFAGPGCATWYSAPGSSSASVIYAYLGIGAVRVVDMSPLLIGPLSYRYCVMVGNPGTMCGQAMQRIGNEIRTPV